MSGTAEGPTGRGDGRAVGRGAGGGAAHGAADGDAVPGTGAVDEVVVGPRLRGLREERGLSLATLSEQTGISVSTLSRLETGVRTPGLGHLVALARVHGVSLDDLVGVRFSRDPRLRFETVEEYGRIIMPLAPIAGGLRVEHAIIRPPAQGAATPDVHVHGPDDAGRGGAGRGGAGPDDAGRGGARRGREGHGAQHAYEPDSLRTHRGYVWMLVLEGTLRLVVGEHDLVIDPGEAAEFDTRVPHWIGPAAAHPVHVLNVHGKDGQRIRVRARPRG